MIELPEWPSSLTMRDNWCEGPFDRHRAEGTLPYDKACEIVNTDAFARPTTPFAERPMTLEYLRHELEEWGSARRANPNSAESYEAQEIVKEVALEMQAQCLRLQDMSEALALHGITDERVVVETARRVVWG